MTTRACCCNNELWYLSECSSADPIAPRYLFKRCDIYELETGQPKADCPADYSPNPYITWNIQRPGCFSPYDEVCGNFLPASSYVPIAMTTNADSEGYQSDYSPNLPVVNTCQYCPGRVCGFILGGPDDILAWLTVDDCCSDACGNQSNGVALGCDLVTSECGVTLSTVANPGGFSTSTVGSFSGTGFLSEYWNASLSMVAPTSWSIIADPAGAYGTYQLSANLGWQLDYTVNVQCGGSRPCFSGYQLQAFTITGSNTVTATVTPSSSACFGSANTDLTVSASSTTLDGPVVNVCNTPNTTVKWRGGLNRSISNDLGCDKLIRWDRTNYIALAFVVKEPTFTSIGCAFNPSWGSGTNSGGLAYLEILNPLGPRSVYCP